MTGVQTCALPISRWRCSATGVSFSANRPDEIHNKLPGKLTTNPQQLFFIDSPISLTYVTYGCALADRYKRTAEFTGYLTVRQPLVVFWLLFVDTFCGTCECPGADIFLPDVGPQQRPVGMSSAAFIITSR